MSAEPTAREEACFEAGIKLGSLYHQFAGTPLSPESAPHLARAMESAIVNQPYCEAVRVEMDHEAIAADCESDHGYVEFTGRYATVEVDVTVEGEPVTAEMRMQEGYPLMRIRAVSDRDDPDDS